MTLKDGKFYEGGQVVPLEFGNKEQIRLTNEAKQHIEDLKGDGLLVEVEIETTYTAKVNFKCTCGQTVWLETELDDENHSKDLVGEITSCRHCKAKYELDENEDGDTVVKFRK